MRNHVITFMHYDFCDLTGDERDLALEKQVGLLRGLRIAQLDSIDTAWKHSARIRPYKFEAYNQPASGTLLWQNLAALPMSPLILASVAHFEH